MNSLPYVALGGAIGASLRYLCVLWGARVFTGSFPMAILTVNVLGSAIMGVCFVLLAKSTLGNWAPLVMTGVLGGFTTFSTFSLEAFTLAERGEWSAALLYVTLSVGLSIAGLALGVVLARGILA